jgi:hypothetical protein
MPVVYIFAQGRSSLGCDVAPGYMKDMKSLLNVPGGQAGLASASEHLLRKLR